MTQALILILIGIIWIIFKIIQGISNSASESNKNRIIQNKRNEIYGTRVIDSSKSLFERNIDIIHKFAGKIETDSSQWYYIENLTRDCINDICLAENKASIRPGHSYLSTWKNGVSTEWLQLANQLQEYFNKTKGQLSAELAKVNNARSVLNKLLNTKREPKTYRDIIKRQGKNDIFQNDLDFILAPASNAWKSTEACLIAKGLLPQSFPSFSSSFTHKEISKLNKEIVNYNEAIKMDIPEHDKNSIFFNKIYSGYKSGIKSDLLQRIDFIINDIHFPPSFPKIWDSDFDSDQGIVIIEIALPDIVHNQIFKEVQLKSKISIKPLAKKEYQELAPKFHPAVMLRVAYEIFMNDEEDKIKLLALNGWVEYNNPATGNISKTYTSCLVVNRNQILELTLIKLDPQAAFLNLKGKSSGSLIDIIPITPTLTLIRKDKRFIETKEVIDNLSKEANIAAMDWQDFESLIAELFEKEFSDKGAEVKVTQSSRDRGVDAIIFDPDPIKGGKFVVQAKRWTNTVDVSAVRDLCAVVKKEGASRGILVTTSNYGPDAYAFAQNEPITLLNGSELLGLLSKHGYKFRINITEARQILKASE
jgi:restriction system protein